MSINTYFEEVSVWPGHPKMLWAYITGFILSLVSTGFAYHIATSHALPGRVAITVVVLLAAFQFIAQLIFFLHLTFKKERENLERIIVLSCAIFIVAVIVGGSVWIMYTLNDRMMVKPENMVHYMDSQSGL